MSAQFDKHVDAVGADALAQRRVVELVDAMPLVRGGTETRADRIVDAAGVVEHMLRFGAIEFF